MINQGFGANPAYYAKFLDSQGKPEKGHMGVDYMAIHATPLYAPCDGMAFYEFDSHGGDGIYIRTQDTFDYGNGQAYFTIILWHLCGKDDPQFKPIIPCDGKGYLVKTGALIGYTDNTGAPFESSGDHLHFGLYPSSDKGGQVQIELGNGFDGCIDPTPYFTNYFAQDINKIQAIQGQEVTATEQVVQLIAEDPGTIPIAQKIGLLQAILNFLKGLINQ